MLINFHYTFLIFKIQNLFMIGVIILQGMLLNFPTKIGMKHSGLSKHVTKVIGMKCGISQSFATPKTRRINVGLATVMFVVISYETRCTRET